jgi:hypothetical protein
MMKKHTQAERIWNRMLRRIFGPRRDGVTGSGGNYIIKT